MTSPAGDGGGAAGGLSGGDPDRLAEILPEGQDPQRGLDVRVFDESSPDGVFHFHMIRFSRNQLYVWVGYNSDRSQGAVHAAVPTKFERMPLCSTLLGQSSSDTDSASMACRLAKKAGCGVVLALNLPRDSPMLQAFAERRAVREINSWLRS